jgi:hypothetical protein
VEGKVEPLRFGRGGHADAHDQVQCFGDQPGDREGVGEDCEDGDGLLSQEFEASADEVQGGDGAGGRAEGGGCPSRTFSTRSQTRTPAQVAATVLKAATAALPKWPLNIGVLGLVASFGVGYFMLGMSDKDIMEEFPASIVLTIIGVTYFFSMASGTGPSTSSSRPGCP